MAADARKKDRTLKRFRLRERIEIAVPVGRVFSAWSRLEDLPRVMESVRRVKCIDETRSLWDVDLIGRQVVWEARIVEAAPGKRIRWQSTWGAPNAGEVRFEELPEGRTLLCVEIDFEPDGPIERLGTRLGLVGFHVRRDLDRFRTAVERGRNEAGPAPRDRDRDRALQTG